MQPSGKRNKDGGIQACLLQKSERTDLGVTCTLYLLFKSLQPIHSMGTK